MSPGRAASPLVAKEVRALLPMFAGSAAALAGALTWPERPVLYAGLFGYVAGTIGIGAHAVGQEYAYGTLPMLLAQPADRRGVYRVKVAVSSAMILALAALAWASLGGGALGHHSRPATLLALPVLCGLLLAPWFTMLCRSTIAGVVFSIGFAGAWLGLDTEAARNAAVGRWTAALTVACLAAGVLGWRRFLALEADGDAPFNHLHAPRWLARIRRPRTHRPLRALAGKEIRLQQLTLVVAGLCVAGWIVLMQVQQQRPAWWTFPLGTVLLLYSISLGLVIGALASAEERQFGTFETQALQPVPAWQQWMVKAGVAIGLALLLGIGLPAFLLAVAPPRFAGVRLSADLAVFTAMLTAGSLYISTLSRTGIGAIALTLPAGVAVAVSVAAVRTASGSAAAALVERIASARPGLSAPDLLPAIGLTTYGGAAVLVSMLVGFGFVNHTSTARPVRRVVGQGAWLVGVILAGTILRGVLQALSLRVR